MTAVSILRDKSSFLQTRTYFPLRHQTLLFGISGMINKKTSRLQRDCYESTTDLKKTSTYLISAGAAVAVAGLITVDRR
jgi:hypothetical protein